MIEIVSCASLLHRLAGAHPPVLVEAVPSRCFENGHRPGARHFPSDVIDLDAATRALPDRAAEVVVYCTGARCGNSQRAAEQLVALGYTRISVFAEGKEAWRAAGLPLEASSVRGVAP